MGLFRRSLRAAPHRTAGASTRRRLLVEPLEDRRLLAQLVLDVQLWDDDGGAKGGEIPFVLSGSTKTFRVQQGDFFFVQVLADDKRDPGETSQGVIALPVDLKWNFLRGDGADVDTAILIQYADTPPPIFPDTIPTSERIITAEFVRQRFVDGFDVDSQANNLRGGTIPTADSTRPIGVQGCDWEDGTDDCREFGRLRFEALNAGVTLFRVDMDGSMSFEDGAQLENDPLVEVQIEVVPSSSSISGFVYIDDDNDGVRDPEELPLPNVTISCDTCNNGLSKSVTTGPDGWYHFENLAAGTYAIQETHPAGFVDGRDTAGRIVAELVVGNSSATVGQDKFSNIVLAAGQHAIDFNFGERGLSQANKRMFLASTPVPELLVCRVLGINAAYVEGTSGNDAIDVRNDGAAISVYVNDVPNGPYPISEYQMVVVDALGGTDAVEIQGTSTDEATQLQPDSVALRRDDVGLQAGYGVRVKHVETASLATDGGTDLVVIRDTAGNDALTLGSTRVDIGWAGGNTGNAQSLADTDDLVRAISVAGGTDTAQRNSPSYAVQLLGNWMTVSPAVALAAEAEGPPLSVHVASPDGAAASSEQRTFAITRSPAAATEPKPVVSSPPVPDARRVAGQPPDAKAVIRQLGRLKRI